MDSKISVWALWSKVRPSIVVESASSSSRYENKVLWGETGDEASSCLSRSVPLFSACLFYTTHKLHLMLCVAQIWEAHWKIYPPTSHRLGIPLCLLRKIQQFTVRNFVGKTVFFFRENSLHTSQLSNLWWIPNSVSMGFGTAIKTGSSRGFKRNPTTYRRVSSQLPFTEDC